jgi:hypothetical protein
MSENRSSYSSAPLQDLKRKPPKQEPAKAPGQISGTIAASPRSFIALQVMLVAVLPLVFIISLLAKDTRLYWGFTAASLLCLGMMAVMKAFVPNARRVLTVIHAAMIAVSLFAILVTAPPVNDSLLQQPPDLASIFSEDSSASIVDMAQAFETGQPDGSSNSNSASLAQQKLEQFMSAWGSKDYASMVAYSAPNWVDQFEDQREAETSIFHLTAIRTPLDYQVIDVSGSDSDQTRTITMQASISKNDGREPQKYNFQILMIRANNEWYVDPNSISSSQVVQQAGQVNQTQQAAPLVEATVQPSSSAVRSDTVLFYNQDGGQYYHLDANCASVADRYKPLTAMFYFRDVSNDTFKNLIPCPVCKAPAR